MKRHPFSANGSEFADLAVAATVRQCLSAIISKLSTRDTNQILGKASLQNIIQELAKTSHKFVGSKCFTLVGLGLATID